MFMRGVMVVVIRWGDGGLSIPDAQRSIETAWWKQSKSFCF